MSNEIGKPVNLRVTVDELYEGYVDYWEGHGHIFADKSTKACMIVSVPVNYTETNQELIDSLVSEANQDWDFLEDTTESEQEAITEQITDADIEKAIRDYLGGKPEDSAFIEPDEPFEEDSELPSLILVLHVWREE